MAKLSYRDAQGRLREHVIRGGQTTIGRHPNQDIQVLDRVVSKEHAVIVATPEGFKLQDGGSRNGTFLNGLQLDREAPLSEGDKITVGSTDIVFHSDERATITNFDSRVTIASEGLETHIRSRLAQELEGRFVPEGEIHDVVFLRRDYEKLRIAHELNQSINPEMDLQLLLEKILDKALEIFPADRGVILMRDDLGDATGTLVPMVVKSGNPNEDVSNVSISSTIVSAVLEEKQALLSSDAMMDSRFNKSHSIILEQIRSTMSVPLVHEDEVLGVIHLDSKIARGAFTEKDLQLLAGFARQAALMVEHNRLLKRMRDEVVVREQLHRLLSPHLVEEVVSGRIKMETTGGVLRWVTVLFADIRNFTSMSEKMPPQEMVHMLNDYFEWMVDIIFKYEGTLDKFVGDEIMAIWGAPLAHPNDSERAVRCAVEMQETLNDFNQEREQRGESIVRIGVGLNSGECVAGYMGSTKSMSYTVMGDTVNVASRLCSAAGPGEILVGPQTQDEVSPLFAMEKLPPTKLKGKDEAVDIYRVKGLL